MRQELARALPVIGEYIPTMQPSYADFEEVMQAHQGRTFADVKYDGYRMQVHRSKDRFKVFTRNGNELNYECYPDITRLVERLPVCIVEAELVAEGANHKKMFDKVKKRFRREGISEKSMKKYAESGIIDDVPLHLRIFETLRFEKKGLLYTPLEERRKITGSFDIKGIEPAESTVITSAEALESLVEQTLKQGHEGRVCKNPDSLYLPGKATIDWVKFKRSEPLDLVVIGLYKSDKFGQDRPFTSVLVAAYNDKTGKYETMGKVGVTRKGLAEEIDERIRGYITDARPEDVVFSDKLDRDAFRKFVPSSYINPESSVVLEVKAMNLNLTENWQTCGLRDGKAFSMRIGFAEQVRYDKTVRQATTTDAIRILYRLQEKQGEKNESSKA
jgi:ATP-dependent DNA ligase